jgi:hypothetical protein
MAALRQFAAGVGGGNVGCNGSRSFPLRLSLYFPASQSNYRRLYGPAARIRKEQ